MRKSGFMENSIIISIEILCIYIYIYIYSLSGGIVTWRTLGVWGSCLCGTLWLHAVQRIAWSLALHLCFSSFESHNQGIATRCVAVLRLCSLFWSKGTSASLGLYNPASMSVDRSGHLTSALKPVVATGDRCRTGLAACCSFSALDGLALSTLACRFFRAVDCWARDVSLILHIHVYIYKYIYIHIYIYTHIYVYDLTQFGRPHFLLTPGLCSGGPEM